MNAPKLFAVALAAATLGGSMPPRSLSDALDGRHHRQASVISGTYLHPIGPAHAAVLLDGSDTPITVPVAVGPKTWAPDSRVSLARPAGASPRHEIIGGPTSGQGGGSSLAARRVPPGMPPADTYYAFITASLGDVAEAWRYLDGSPAEFLGEFDAGTPGAGAVPFNGSLGSYSFDGWTVVLGDPTRRVHDGALPFSGSIGHHIAVCVWDPQANVVHTLDTGLEASLDHMSAPFSYGGAVFWWTSLYNVDPDLAFADFTLHRADADLASETTVGSVAAIYASSGPGGSGSLMLSPSAVEYSVDRTIVRMNYSGGGGGSQEFGADSPDLFGYAGGGGTIAGAQTGPFATVFRKADALGAAYAALWPTGGAFSLQVERGLSTSRDGTVALHYGLRFDPATASDTLLGILGRTAAPGAAPLKTFELEATPAGHQPDLFVCGY